MSREYGLGLFVAGTLAILVAGIFLIGRRQSLFSRTYPLKAQFDNVGGLNGGAAVRVGGIYQGTVSEIQLPHTTTDRVTVVMALENGTRNLLRKDSVASIKAEGVLGDKYIEVSIGSENERVVKDGETIRGEPPLDISDLIDKANRILDSSTEAVDNAVVITDHLASVSSKIDQGKGTFGALINDKTLYRQAAAGTTSFRDNMQALKHNFFLRGFFRDRGYENAEELTKHAIPSLPKEREIRRFVYAANRIFDKPDTAKLVREKELQAAGRFLESGEFGMAVVVVSGGMKGDSEEVKVLTQARAMVVREYLVDHFRFDDTRLRTFGMGETKRADDGGKLELIIYAAERK